MAVIPNGFAQANMKFTGVGWPTGGEVTFGFDTGLAATPAAAAALIITFWTDNLRVRTPTHLKLSSVLVKYGPNDVGPFAEVASGLAGTGSSTDVQPNMAVLVQKHTALGGKINRGRWFWPVAEDQVNDGGALGSGDITAMDAACAGFLDDLEVPGGQMVILHVDPSVTPTPVISMSTQAVCATQRRRLRR